MTYTIKQVADAALLNIYSNWWNPNAVHKNHNGTYSAAGGLYINADDNAPWPFTHPYSYIYNINNPLDVSNIVPSGLTSINSHDPQVCLLSLTAFTGHYRLYPSDHTYDTANALGYMDISSYLNHVIQDFQPSFQIDATTFQSGYSNPKGWVYFALLTAWQNLQNTDLKARGIITQSQIDNLQDCVVNAAWTYYNSWYFPNATPPITNAQIGNIQKFSTTLSVAGTAGDTTITLTSGKTGSAQQGVIVFADPAQPTEASFIYGSWTTSPNVYTLALYESIASITLATSLTSGTVYTSISVAALPYAVRVGDTFTLAVSSTSAQQQTVTATATAALGATVVSVASFTATYNYIAPTAIMTKTSPASLLFSHSSGVPVTIYYYSYSPSQSMLCAAALIDASQRFPTYSKVFSSYFTMTVDPTNWTLAGKGVANAIDTRGSLDPTFGMFYAGMYTDVNNAQDEQDGANNYQAKMETEAEVCEGYMRVASLIRTTNPADADSITAAAYFARAKTVMQATYNVLWDAVTLGGGFLFAYDMTPSTPSGSRLQNSFKEVRSTALSARTYHLMNLESTVTSPTLITQEQAVLNSLCNYFFKSIGGTGYYYRYHNDFSVFYNGYGVATQVTTAATSNIGDTSVPLTAKLTGTGTLMMTVNHGAGDEETLPFIAPTHSSVAPFVLLVGLGQSFANAHASGSDIQYVNGYGVTVHITTNAAINIGDAQTTLTARFLDKGIVTLTVNPGGPDAETLPFIVPSDSAPPYALHIQPGSGAGYSFANAHAIGATIQTVSVPDYVSTLSSNVSAGASTVNVVDRSRYSDGKVHNVLMIVGGNGTSTPTGIEEMAPIVVPSSSGVTALTIINTYNEGLQNSHSTGENITAVPNKNRESQYTSEAIGSTVSDLLLTLITPLSTPSGGISYYDGVNVKLLDGRVATRRDGKLHNKEDGYGVAAGDGRAS